MAKKIRIPKPYRPPQTEAEERKFGAVFGARTARENITQYGCTFAEAYGLRDLPASLKADDTTTFDRAYTRAYIEMARKLGCRVPAQRIRVPRR
jgi:hypothetical protein